MMLLSRTLLRSAARQFAIVAAALVGLFSLLDFVEQLAAVGQGDYRVIDALAYVILTIPARLPLVAPVGMLLASLLTLGALSRNGEYAAMLALGVPPRRIVGAVLWLVVPVTVALFLIAQFVAPPLQQLAQAQRSQALSTAAGFHPENSLWAQGTGSDGDGQYLNVRRFARGGVPTDIDIYRFAPDGQLATALHANAAAISPDGTWALRGVTRTRLHDGQFAIDQLATLSWPSFLAPQQVRNLFLPIDSMAPVALYTYVAALARQHQPAPQYAGVLWAHVALPFSMAAMVLIAAPFAFGPPRSNSTGRNIAIGTGVGIVFALVQQMLDHAGLLFAIPPRITALLPPLLAAALAIWLGRSVWRG